MLVTVKKEACWAAARELDLDVPGTLPVEMAGRTVVASNVRGDSTQIHEQLSPEDYRNMEICKSIDGEGWLRIHAWGIKTGKLAKWQIGIAHTIAGYAASDWGKGPSQKQAKHGAAMLNLAREEGVIIAPN